MSPHIPSYLDSVVFYCACEAYQGVKIRPGKFVKQVINLKLPYFNLLKPLVTKEMLLDDTLNLSYWTQWLIETDLFSPSSSSTCTE